MAVARQIPKCMYCGKEIAKAVHKKSSQFFAGDSFLHWQYFNHSCKEKRKALKEIKNDPERKKFIKKFNEWLDLKKPKSVKP